MSRKAETDRGRNPNLRSSIYKGADGSWHGRVTVGVRDDGKPDRRHVRGTTKAAVAEKVRKLERDRDRGTVRKPGERFTVAGWLTHWLNTIAIPPRVTPNTHDGYRIDVEKHLIPGLGSHWLDKLEPEHLERLYAKMQGSGLSAGTAHHVHRTARNALNEAVRRQHLVRNPALLAKAPALSDEEAEHSVGGFSLDLIGRDLGHWRGSHRGGEPVDDCRTGVHAGASTDGVPGETMSLIARMTVKATERRYMKSYLATVMFRRPEPEGATSIRLSGAGPSHPRRERGRERRRPCWQKGHA